MESRRAVVIYGAAGHTGRFVVAELLKRGFRPIVSGRSRGKLEELASIYGDLEVREASVEDPASLDRALAGAAAVINCAGPFARTAEPLIEAALRARIPYLDVAAEIEVASAAFENYGEAARNAGVYDTAGRGVLRRPRRSLGKCRYGRPAERGRHFDCLRTEQLEPNPRNQSDERRLVAA